LYLAQKGHYYLGLTKKTTRVDTWAQRHVWCRHRYPAHPKAGEGKDAERGLGRPKEGRKGHAKVRTLIPRYEVGHWCVQNLGFREAEISLPRGVLGFFASEVSAHMNDRLLLPHEVAERLGVHVRALHRLRQERKGPPFIEVTARHVRYSERQIDAWLQARTVNGTPKQRGR
jgi:predicted DNA-binding transcriptional regulator AlpA